MTGAPLPADEYRRLLDLARYQILDSGQDETFDRITRLAARVLQVPVAVLNLVDQHRQWGKSAYGLGDTTAPRQDSFCAWTILDDGPLVVEDAPRDPRFRQNPMVTGAPHIRMYAGAPLISPAGHRIGTLCVTDDKPHPLSAEDLQALQDLAAIAMNELELRRQQLDAQHDAQAQRQQVAELRRTLEQARILEGVSSLMDLELEPEQATLAAASLISEAISADYAALMTWHGDTFTVQAAHHQPGVPAAVLTLAQQLPQMMGGVTRSLRDLARPLYLHDYAAHPQALPELVAAGVAQAAWIPLGEGGSGPTLLMAVRLQGHAVTDWRAGDRTLLEAAGRTIRHALQRRAALQQIHDQAREDALTGLLNRRAFDEDLDTRERGSEPFTLAVIDLDGLKVVNDTEGHAQGDRLLQVFAAALAAQAGEGGAAYRLGGDEFALLLPDQGEAEVLARIDVAMGAAAQLTTQRTGASAGVVRWAEEAHAPARLALADQRMYAAKRRRRASVA
ncbi:diguanylate cyclase domain-containing protein [Deinococcus multiflagellatus]|uniref:Diguanylate cyclase domain-containing protein n=1 Tax=Deinococcus multiflagellatus TaxID=1656887 RepID=A0ABW1ZS08_9DEIO|nr:sensor domain-containing diguanylate cyclase [Deinococcus multiflagellatus]MBZ9715042.1 sensor domain-containing diguanylate cyclase [Deinococcus multiflagellatus]